MTVIELSSNSDGLLVAHCAYHAVVEQRRGADARTVGVSGVQELPPHAVAVAYAYLTAPLRARWQQHTYVRGGW